jgi:tRNA U55 pseudouridine synthase TruB
MKFDDLARKQYDDIANLCLLLKNYVDAYRLLIGGASELYNVNIAKKSEVKKALERVEQVGDLIDKLINTLDKCEVSYFKYCKIKNDYITISTEKDKIFTEIDNELSLQNSEIREV